MFIAVPFKVAWLIRVAIEERPLAGGDSHFITKSPDLPGLLISSSDLGPEFSDGICQAIVHHLDAMGQTDPIKVIRINHPERETGYWHFAAIPKALLVDASGLRELKANGWTFRVGDRVGVRGSMSRQDFDSQIIEIEDGSTAPDASDADAAWIVLADGYRVRPWLLVKL